MALHRLDKLIHLHEGYRKVFRVGGAEIVLIEQEQRRVAFLNQCPHQGRPLHNGQLSGTHLRCAAHGFEFDIFTGRAVGRTPDCGRLQFLPVVLDGDSVCVEF